MGTVDAGNCTGGLYLQGEGGDGGGDLNSGCLWWWRPGCERPLWLSLYVQEEGGDGGG